ncbi:MAG: hypothetical protein ACRDWD_00610 [Acidimicrobiia bacterium]
MGETNGLVDEGFLRRYRALLDAEAGAFDELEHAYEDGDRAHYESDLEEWRTVLVRRIDFLNRHGLAPRPTRTRTRRTRTAGA